MKYLLLHSAAYVGGKLRHPHEGAIPVDDADAEQPLAEDVADDVTGDFAAVETGAGDIPATAEITDPQPAEVAPAETTSAAADVVSDHVADKAPETKPTRRKAAATQE